MTHQEIMVQIVSEVFGKSKMEINRMISDLRKYQPEGNWDKELSDKESQKLLDQLRNEKQGIHAWFVRGAMKAVEHESSNIH